jgi:hypothetical protein
MTFIRFAVDQDTMLITVVIFRYRAPLRAARSSGFHGGKVHDHVVGNPTAVGVTELRAQRP